MCVEKSGRHWRCSAKLFSAIQLKRFRRRNAKGDGIPFWLDPVCTLQSSFLLQFLFHSTISFCSSSRPKFGFDFSFVSLCSFCEGRRRPFDRSHLFSTYVFKYFFFNWKLPSPNWIDSPLLLPPSLVVRTIQSGRFVGWNSNFPPRILPSQLLHLDYWHLPWLPQVSSPVR